MKPQTLSQFSLPFQSNSWKLTPEILDKYCGLKSSERYSYMPVTVREIDYQNEVLTLGVLIAGEVEQQVYLQVCSRYLLVSCSTDTDETYLSRYAYYGLREFITNRHNDDFNSYYSPGFFDLETGISKYLDIVKDKYGISIRLKRSYSPFFKPGQELYLAWNPFKPLTRPKITPAVRKLISEEGTGLGYCLAETYFNASPSNHWPFLIPYTFVPTRNGNAVKTFTRFIKEDTGLPALDYDASQKALNKLCYQMMALAPITTRSNSEAEKEEARRRNVSNRKQLFLLWHRALPRVLPQQFTHHLHTHWMRKLKVKPERQYMETCSYSADVPRLCFSWRDQGEYYELHILFRAGDEVLMPALYNAAFFISPIDAPMQFYLLNSLQDYYVLNMFRKYNNCISVFKVHYERYFKQFKAQLEKVYEVV